MSCDVCYSTSLTFFFPLEEAFLCASKTITVRRKSVITFSVSLFCVRKSTVLVQLFFCLFGLDCSGVFKGKYKLWDHLRIHTQERAVACPTCGGMFSNNTKLFDHAKKQVSEDSKWIYFYFCLYF